MPPGRLTGCGPPLEAGEDATWAETEYGRSGAQRRTRAGAPRRHMVREAMADRRMVRSPQDRNANQRQQTQRRRRPAKVPRLRRHHRLHRHVNQAPRAKRTGHASADGRPPRRDPCPHHPHGKAQPPQATRPARPGPDSYVTQNLLNEPPETIPVGRAGWTGYKPRGGHLMTRESQAE